MTKTWILIVALAGLVGCAPSPPKAKADARVQVLAGDLLMVHGKVVRLANAQAPALPPHAHCWGEAALAVQAAAKAEALIGAAQTVAVAPEGRDADGRTLARVSLSGSRDLGEALVFAGVAARRTAQPWDWCGRTDFAQQGGPEFGAGPEHNSEFMGWVAGAEAQRMNSQATSTYPGSDAAAVESYAF